MSILASVGRYLWAFINSQPTNTPMAAPPMTIHPKLRAASCHTKRPVVAAIRAKRKIISEEASFSKLSPSKMDDIRFGTLTNFRIAPALMASGGDTIPPSKNPNANENPGMNQSATNATDRAVKKTTINAKLVTMRRHRHSSFHDMAKAASYNSGGRKMIKINSGSMCILGSPGSKLISNPVTTNSTG